MHQGENVTITLEGESLTLTLDKGMVYKTGEITKSTIKSNNYLQNKLSLTRKIQVNK